ncbi:ATP-binding protein [Spirulina major CS-329]|uniref:ATP-binding protein n=1 Tax=Spirulina TaxID=1154 RepID=UPI00232D6826|nr:MULTISPECIES: ATP-binding protein [Spirulina]MDB9496608.1 ATP-binding protein [Spirulina subsalsa CS-330]MDB9505027.1 ATP-binding protein [Spirulina major CS-329]
MGFERSHPSQSDPTWYQDNYDYLGEAIAAIQTWIDRTIAQSQDRTAEMPPPPDETGLAAIAAQMSHPPALVDLCQRFGLSTFERDVLVLCVGRALHPEFRNLCAIAHQQPQCTYPTFQLALQLFPHRHWQALTPHAPLRRWQLLHNSTDDDITHARLQIDESILHYLLGEPYSDGLLAGVIEPLSSQTLPLSASHGALVEPIAAMLTAAQSSPIVQLCGANPEQRQAIAIAVSHASHAPLYRISLADLPTAAPALTSLILCWQRFVILTGSLLVCDLEAGLGSEQTTALQRFVHRLNAPLLLSTAERIELSQGAIAVFNLPPLTHPEQWQLWHNALGPLAETHHAALNDIIAHFTLSPRTIQTASLLDIDPDPTVFKQTLWTFCRHQARPRLDHLAQRIDAIATWDDLVLGDREKALLNATVDQVNQRHTVYETWGFASKGRRGLGITALFAGPSGTGKTMAAEAIARELNLDLYRIDLSAVTSKYIGETEKNLRQIFDAAEAGGVVLLFDEADALFGKRTQVKDSHDRHANMEVSYLLQRMEAYHGLAILTTNLKDNLDDAFTRRLRFIINFPFPEAESRAQIWQQIFPPQMPQKGLDIDLLSQLNITGGNIRSIAMNVAFLAAQANEPVTMQVILQAAQAEYLKFGQSLTPAETRGWRKRSWSS